MSAIEDKKEHDRVDDELLVNEYYDKIYVYISRRINSPHDAEDLTAEVFLKAFANPYNPQLAKFSTYIYTIAGNMLKNYYRARSTHVELFCVTPDSDTSDEDLLEDLISKED